MKFPTFLATMWLVGAACGSGGESLSMTQVADARAVASVGIEQPSSPFEDVAARDSLRSLVGRADYICRARVRAVTSKRERYLPNIEMVMSRITLEILATWKGNLRSGSEIRSFGGRLEGIPYFADPFPEFHEGEEVVLFLADFIGGIFPVGHRDGVIRVADTDWSDIDRALQEFLGPINKANQRTP